MKTNSTLNALYKLARCYGIQTAYYNMNHKRCQASPQSLTTALRLMGAPIEGIPDANSALREYDQKLWRQPLDPVTVVWDGTKIDIPLRLQADMADIELSGYLLKETGDQIALHHRNVDTPVVDRTDVEGITYVVRTFPIPGNVPRGYHRLNIELPGANVETLIISSPLKSYTYSEEHKLWGVFLPLYALHSNCSWGAGDISDLERLVDWTAKLNGNVVGTLPMLPAFFNDKFEYSPYAPISRLAWNEFYADATRAPFIEKCPEAVNLLNSRSFKSEIDELRRSSSVDYSHQMSLKRKLLEKLAQCCFEDTTELTDKINTFAESNPDIDMYSRFRAVHDSSGDVWRKWPDRLHDGVITDDDYQESVRRYYLYTQWLLHYQMEDLYKKSCRLSTSLYLDFPLGVHRDGYDVWRNRDVFIHEASVGAPPDPAFTGGQDWKFPPLHPELIRHSRYKYYISSVRHHLKYAGMLRIDHVMGLHRLFVIPDGTGPDNGVYIRYRPEEFYAILALESHRAKSLIVGEDLGTVPPEVRPAMNKHGIYRNYVVQYELFSGNSNPLPEIPRNAVASINTHDMPTFTSFWHGTDITGGNTSSPDNSERGIDEFHNRKHIKDLLIRALIKRGWLKKGLSDKESIMSGLVKYMSASNSTLFLINLEDLWSETEPHNIPGTQGKRPNWSRKARYSLENFSRIPEVRNTLQIIDHMRKQGVN